MKTGKLLAQVLVVLPSLMLGDVKIGLSRRGSFESRPLRHCFSLLFASLAFPTPLLVAL
jgi:hypothetical protein